MKNDKLERMLNHAKQQESLEINEIPKEVESKLQDIYQAIEQRQSAQQIREKFPLSSDIQQKTTEKMTPSTVRTRNNTIRRYSATVAATLIIGIGGIIGSGYVSTDMAHLAKQIPGTNQIYQFTSAFGWVPADDLQSFTSQPSVTQEGVTLTLSYLIYDGKKIYVHLQQQANAELHGYQAINLSVNGESLTSADNTTANLQWSENKEKKISDLSWQKDLTSEMLPVQSNISDSSGKDISASDLPEELDVQLNIQLQDMPDQPFIFNIHVQRDVPQTYQLKDYSQAKEGITYNKVTVTGTSASTFVELQASGIKEWRSRYYLQHGHYPITIGYILLDSMNKVYKTELQNGDFTNEALEYNALPKEMKEVTLIPWTFNEEPILKNRLFSNKSNSSTTPAMIDMGQTGKVNLLKIESTPEKYVLHIQTQEVYQSYMIAYSFWYGQLNKDGHETYPSEVTPDPEHKGQFLVSFEKSKLKTNDQLHYSVNKIRYLEPMHIKGINQ